MKIDGNLKFVHIDGNYMKALYNACSEVYYRPHNYESKPYLGILLTNNGKKYVIPLTSAKEKHKTWKNVSQDSLLIYEVEPYGKISQNDIFVPMPYPGLVKHIFSVLDIKKMIPVTDAVYTVVNINHSPNDTIDEKKYKDLLNKEYGFCVKKTSTIEAKATRLYDAQMRTGRIGRFCCDFKALEKVCKNYK